MAEAGKGSRARPLSVDRQTYESNWDSIFSQSKEYFERDKDRSLDERIVDYSDEDQQ